MQQKAFNDGELSTHYLENNPIETVTPIELSALCAATFVQLSSPRAATSPWQINDAWQANLHTSRQHDFCHDNNELSISLSEQGDHYFKSSLEGYETYQACLNDYNSLTLNVNQQHQTFNVYVNNDKFDVISANAHHTLALRKPNYSHQEQSQGSLNAPMPGMVISVTCQEKQIVEKNQVLMIIEAMKMEHQIKAPFAGTIDALFYKSGNQVNEGQALLSLKEIKENA